MTKIRFFHLLVKQCQSQAMIHQIKNSSGRRVSSNVEIGDEIVSFFKILFSTNGTPKNFLLLRVIPAILIEEDNTLLESNPSIEEVY